MDILKIQNLPAEIAARAAAIGGELLLRSAGLKRANFDRISTDDLACLFELYDRAFFDSFLGQAVKAKTGRALLFRLSRAMTRAGGKTILFRRRTPAGEVESWYEIAVASQMLFMTFGQVDRPVVVCGLACADRLAALQRIIEHEIIHLVELVTFGKSSCAAARFRALAANIFGHTGTTHALVTPREHAAVHHGVTVGGLVEFEFEGRRLAGRVNRLNRRATVLVEDAAGRPYSDGKKYAKFYVPLGQLRSVGAPIGGASG